MFRVFAAAAASAFLVVVRAAGADQRRRMTLPDWPLCHHALVPALSRGRARVVAPLFAFIDAFLVRGALLERAAIRQSRPGRHPSLGSWPPCSRPGALAADRRALQQPVVGRRSLGRGDSCCWLG